MSTRHMVLILVLVMGAAACGGTSPEQIVTATDRLRLDVVSEPGELVSGDAATFALRVTNVSDVPVTLGFDTTQRGDVRLSTVHGVEVYHWADHRAFAQEREDITFAPGERVVFPLQEAPLPVAPGEYDVLATVTGTPKLQVARSTVSVVGPNALTSAASDPPSA